MPEPIAEPKGTVKLFGLKIPQDKERKFILIASAIGIGGVLLLVLKNRASGAVNPNLNLSGTNQPTDSTSSSSSSTGAGGVTGPLPTVELRFSESTSPTVFGQSSGGGGGGLSIGGFSIGGSASHQNGNGLTVSNTFSADTIISNATDAEITSIENWLTGLAGTQQERANQAQTEINQYQTAVLGHKTPASPVPGTVG